MTHEEIGQILGISRQSVQVIEASAMKKLRRLLGSDFRGSVVPFLLDPGLPEPWENDDSAITKRFRRKNP